MKFRKTSVNKIADSFRNIRAAVLGDVMVDAYLWGKVERISPEAPVPVVSLQKKEYRPGGAANVALNLVALGVQTDIISIVGRDDMGEELKHLIKNSGISHDSLISSEKRVTTCKTRIICHNQQMIRIDDELITDISKEDEDLLISVVKKYISNSKPDIFLLEDYNKGVLTERVIIEVIRLCRENGIITFVDPKRKNFFAYQEVDIIKPNLKEAREALGIDDLKEINVNALEVIHTALQQRLNHGISLISLSEHGVFYQNGKSGSIIPSHLRVIADVSGAGDTVMAVAAAVFAVTNDIEITAQMANVAGGLVCEKVGTAIVNKEKLFEESLKLDILSN